MSLWKELRPPPANRTKQLFWCLSARETDICNTCGQERSLNLPHSLSKGGLRQSRGGLNDRDGVFQGPYLQMGKVPSVALHCGFGLEPSEAAKSRQTFSGS